MVVAARFQVRLEDAFRKFHSFELALDERGLPQYTSHFLEPVRISVYSQSEEARYANLLPGVGSVYAQEQLDGGMGKKTQVRREEAQFDHYYYADWFDLSVRGQGQKGPAVTTLAAPTNSGPLTGFFTLGGVPYLVLGRRIASWASDALTAVHDYGADIAGAQSVVFSQLAAEATVESNTTTTTVSALASVDDRLAQGFRLISTGAHFLSSVQVKLTRLGLATPGTPAITNAGTGGAVTWTYKVSAVTGVGETPVSAAGSTTTGNATLSATNYNVVAWAAVPGATSYKIYRTVAGTTPASTGLIGISTSTSFNDTGFAGDGATPNATDTSGQIAGDVRLSIMADLNGSPSMQIITSASMAALQVPMTATVMTFRFDDDASMALPFNVPLWLVLDCPGATPYQTMSWSRTNNSSAYARGTMKVSTDRGNAWAAVATTSDAYFVVGAKVDTTTAFIGTSTAAQLFKTTTDGATFTADTYRYSQHFAVAGGKLVRSIQNGATAAALGALEWSTDGVNWNSDAIIVGDPTIPITALQWLTGETIIIVKQDSIYAVDLGSTPVDIQPLYTSNPSSTNGVGTGFWKGAVYIPFNGRLMAITGDPSAGFTVYESVGIEALREWDWPQGQGRHVACVGTRHHLYSVVSSASGYRLFKSADPLRKKADGTPNPEWHGSLATIGNGAQTVNMLACFDPGGSGSPQLFCTTSNNDVARVQLPRTFNPAADPAYTYDISEPGNVFLPIANGNYPVHPKAWLSESTTFASATAGDYADMLYDSQDGQGWHRLGRLYDTGALAYPGGLESVLLGRCVQVVNTAATASPRLMAHAVGYAIRHIKGAAMRELAFTVVAQDGLSAADLGEMLGTTANGSRDLLEELSGTGLGTRRMEDPYGRVYERVLFLDAKEDLHQMGRPSSGQTFIQISAVAIG